MVKVGYERYYAEHFGANEFMFPKEFIAQNAEVIRQREEMADQLRALADLETMAASYECDISKPATNAVISASTAALRKGHDGCGCLSGLLQARRFGRL